MHQSVNLTDTIWLLQLVISYPLIHALGDLIQAPTGIRTQVRKYGYVMLWQWQSILFNPYKTIYNTVIDAFAY